MSRTPRVVGVFVGGASRRMGGLPKGLLRHPCEPTTLVERALRLGRGVGAEVVLVGAHDAYARLGTPMLADEPSGVGPIGGLVSLLALAAERDCIALACDLPFVPRELLERLMDDGAAAPDVLAVVPRRRGLLEPLCALYRPGMLAFARDAVARGRFALHALVRGAAHRAIELQEQEGRWLDDWDEPGDAGRAASR
jgi:molybdopterin-guanine dinucleotide biosynthesis protein A